MHLVKSLKGAAIVAMLLASGMANASLLKFTLTGDYEAQWQLDSKVTPDAYAVGGFTLFDVQVQFPKGVAGMADLTFYNAPNDGGLKISDDDSGVDFLVTDGPQLYTGTEAAPAFMLGTFTLKNYSGPGRYTLTVADAGGAAPLPEPASAALLFGGLGLMFGLRKRRRA